MQRWRRGFVYLDPKRPRPVSTSRFLPSSPLPGGRHAESLFSPLREPLSLCAGANPRVWPIGVMKLAVPGSWAVRVNTTRSGVLS
jgi:hypothetical protein